MRIGIDARFLTHPQPGGFKTYTEGLIGALAEIDRENQYVLYLDRVPAETDKIPAQPNFDTRIVSGSLPLVGLPWREQISLKRQIAKDQLDLFHAPCLTAPLNLSCPLVITVHDMIWAFPEKYSRSGSLSIKRRLMEWYNYWIPKRVIQRASAVITVSQAAKETIVQYLRLATDHIHVTHEAAGSSFYRITDTVRFEQQRRKYSLPSCFILAIGSADPRKNIKTLVQAYALLPEELRNKYHLVIVWTHSLLEGELLTQIDDLGISGTVRFLQNISNNDLALLYNSASLFVFPSLYEGFGLPLLEAMACGTPVIAANNSSIPEIVGDAGFLFDADDGNALSRVMSEAVSNPLLLREFSNKGLKRSAHFSWNKCGQETVRIYNAVFDKRNGWNEKVTNS